MNKVRFALKNIAILTILISSFIACDKDFATVGSDIIGQNNFGVTSERYPVIAYTNPLGPIQTNNLPLNYLGVYNDPLYGFMSANFVSQVGSSIIDPDFGKNVTLDSVVMTIPYFSTRTDINSDGESIYGLDSIFGGGAINLSIYENKYFLNSIDPNSEFDTPLRYFSNMTTSNGAISASLLEGTPIPLKSDRLPLSNVITDFRPSKQEIILKKDDEISERLAPALRVKLDTTFWHNKIIAKAKEEGQTELSNANNFNNYFRGIYLKATSANTNSGSMALLNFDTDANITLYYTKDPLTEGADRVQSTYVLNFIGNRVNFITNEFDITIPQGNPVTGDEKLYLKGAQGSVAVVDIFNAGTYEDGYSPEFTEFKRAFVDVDPVTGKFKTSKRLVNEANLVFYVDQSIPQVNEPNRIYLYDLKNNTPLLDYFIDLVNTAVPDNSRTNHLGSLQREGGVSSGKGIKYKIKITEHINNLLIRDSTNVKFGLAISGNVNLENTVPQYKVLTSEDDVVQKVPVSSILSPRGTILYGNNTADLTKKLQLEIYYTCIKTDGDCEDN